MDENKIEKVKRGFWPKVKKVAGKVPFLPDAISLYFAMLDSETPLKAKLTIAGALAYFLTPFDAIPDILIGVGYLDDAAVIAAVISAATIYVKEGHRKKAEDFLNSESKPN
ncbi:PF06803 family protein [Leptospira inadai serovar Lyme str. 10]|uniref:PF06803 family protein n=2 Tax=Leptospira inadai serovar Lyme TaxID=293084 RepID=V6H855_9LEPT|nr:YkvA family protein [Leptospira inadai]EQA35021.1 PF06803 family protein [Leptospira inadai serovar Lyme str. 10]PNV73094.1 DUF1232 domain-containing protein [Leptospira inadai serovar Lyme]